jgi:hypothetical protein
VLASSAGTSDETTSRRPLSLGTSELSSHATTKSVEAKIAERHRWRVTSGEGDRDAKGVIEERRFTNKRVS